MTDVESKLASLKEMRNGFFEEYPTSTETDRIKTVRDRAQALIEEIPINDYKLHSVAYNILCGRILALCVNYEERAELYLSKALKLDPDNAKAWAELGSVLLTKEPADFKYAQECFDESLELETSCNALCGLSVALRYNVDDTSVSAKDRKEAWSRSVKVTAEAVRLYPDNGDAHSCQGTVYIRQFFYEAQLSDSDLLEKSIESYEKALTCTEACAQKDPWTHTNLATAYRYLENLGMSLFHLREACRYDRTTVASKLVQLETYIRRVHEAIERRGKLKAKRLQELIALVKAKNSAPKTSPMKEKPITLTPSVLSQLEEGWNRGCELVACVVATIPHESIPTSNVVVVDGDGAYFCVAVSNRSEHFALVIGDLISIARPVLVSCKDLKLSDGLACSFSTIRVLSPLMMTRNGKPFKNSDVAAVRVTISTTDEIADDNQR